MKLRILHALEEYLVTTQNWIYPQITALPNVNSAVLCRLHSKPKEFPLHDVPIFHDWTLGVGSFDRLLRRLSDKSWPINRAERQASSWLPDLIQAHFGPAGWKMMGLARRLRRPLVTTFYGFDAWKLPMHVRWHHRLLRLFQSGDLFIVEGPAMKQRLVEVGCPSSKIRIRTLGNDLGRLEFEPRPIENELRVLLIGRFTPKKGFTDALRACAIAAEAGVRLAVTIVGDAGEDRTSQVIKGELRNVAAEPSLAGKVRFRGFLSAKDTFQTIKEHNVLVCPSRHSPDGDAEGGLPYVLTEAMAMGMLCIGSRHCDIPEAIIDQSTGFLFNQGDVAELARLLAKSKDLGSKLQEIQNNARSHVEKNFNQAIQLKKLEDLYRETVRTHGGRTS